MERLTKKRIRSGGEEVGLDGMKRMLGTVRTASGQMKSRQDNDEGTDERDAEESRDGWGRQDRCRRLRVASIVALSGMSSMCCLRRIFRMSGQVVIMDHVQADAWRNFRLDISVAQLGRYGLREHNLAQMPGASFVQGRSLTILIQISRASS